MAYVLGFFIADGCMFSNKRGSKYVAFYSNDLDILEKIKTVIGVANRIGKRAIRKRMKRPGYVLQIGSRTMFDDLLKLGITPNKSRTVLFPKIPLQFLAHFTRGYFDGDGNVSISAYKRRDRPGKLNRTILSGFTSGSKDFLVGLRERLTRFAHIGSGTLYFANRAHRLYYSVNDSKKLYRFMYPLPLQSLFLDRKKTVFERF